MKQDVIRAVTHNMHENWPALPSGRYAGEAMRFNVLCFTLHVRVLRQFV